MRTAAKLVGSATRRSLPAAALRCRRKFLKFFPDGFRDETYLDWERGYKWEAHQRWRAQLSRDEHASLIRARQYGEVAARAVRIESRTNLLFSFEKMALRDAVRDADGARLFAAGLFEWLYGEAPLERRFEEWTHVIGALPRRQTRVLTWPIVTVFGFIAEPSTHIVLKPNVTREAARRYGFEFVYTSRPTWAAYRSLLDFALLIGRDNRDLKPRDMIDLQGFVWVQGSDEY
jgi:hypothetical protein